MRCFRLDVFLVSLSREQDRLSLSMGGRKLEVASIKLVHLPDAAKLEQKENAKRQNQPLVLMEITYVGQDDMKSIHLPSVPCVLLTKLSKCTSWKRIDSSKIEVALPKPDELSVKITLDNGIYRLATLCDFLRAETEACRVRKGRVVGLASLTATVLFISGLLVCRSGRATKIPPSQSMTGEPSYSPGHKHRHDNKW
jgi:hypothetical protein